MHKKIVLFTVLMLLLAIGPAAQALGTPYQESMVISVADATQTQRRLAEFLYPHVLAHEEEITLPANTRYDDVGPTMALLIQDYPELFHLDRSYTTTYYQNQPDIALSVKPVYSLCAEEAAAARAQLYDRARQLVREYPDAIRLHDALCAMTVYDDDGESIRHNALGPLLTGRAVCEGYAQALTLLYRMAGIPCGQVVGAARSSDGRVERHSWNIALMNGYTLIDATWNDQDGMGLNTHWYYGLSTAMMGADHFPDDGQLLPLCGGQNNWHDLRGWMIDSKDQADEALRRLVNGEVVNLRVTDAFLYQLLTEETVEFINGYNSRHSEACFYGTYSLAASPAQQCLILRRVEE